MSRNEHLRTFEPCGPSGAAGPAARVHVPRAWATTDPRARRLESPRVRGVHRGSLVCDSEAGRIRVPQPHRVRRPVHEPRVRSSLLTRVRRAARAVQLFSCSAVPLSRCPHGRLRQCSGMSPERISPRIPFLLALRAVTIEPSSRETRGQIARDPQFAAWPGRPVENDLPGSCLLQKEVPIACVSETSRSWLLPVEIGTAHVGVA